MASARLLLRGLLVVAFAGAARLAAAALLIHVTFLRRPRVDAV